MSNEMKKTPDVRFEGCTDDWEQHKLGEILKVHPFRPYLAKPKECGKYEVIQQGDTLPAVDLMDNIQSGKVTDTVTTDTLTKYRNIRIDNNRKLKMYEWRDEHHIDINIDQLQEFYSMYTPGATTVDTPYLEESMINVLRPILAQKYPDIIKVIIETTKLCDSLYELFATFSLQRTYSLSAFFLSNTLLNSYHIWGILLLDKKARRSF